MTLRIDIRDRRVDGGRLNISAETDKPAVHAKRKVLVRELIDAGHMTAISLLRARKLHIADVQRAFRSQTLATLIMQHAQENGNGHGKPRTVGAAVDAVLRKIEGNRRPNTYKQYALYGAALVAGLGAGTWVRDVTTDQADGFMKAPRKGGSAWVPTTRYDVRTFARRVWREAGVQRDGNPWYDIELPKKRTTRHVFLQPAEWQALYAFVEGTPVAAALALGVMAGLRIGEVCALRPNIDVDLERRMVRIQPRGGLHPWEAKTDNSVANVPISNELHRILTAHVDAGFAGERYFIIVRKGRDRPLKVHTLENWTKAAFEAVGIKYGRTDDGLTNHSLRHTFASWMAQRDVHPVKMAKLMRDTPETVARVYAHLNSQDLEGPVELVGSLASGREGFEFAYCRCGWLAQRETPPLSLFGGE